MLTEHLLLSKRGELYNRDCYKEQQSKGVNWLTTRSNVDGPMEGSWSLFNAFLFDEIKRANNMNGNLGAGGFHFKHCLLDPPEDEFFDLRKIDQSYPELSILLHEDLGNGLPVHGLWTLCFLGKTYREKTEDTKEGQEHTKKPLLEVTALETEAKALGISDWQTFFESGREPAVEATEWIVARSDKKTATQTRQSLTIVWACCFRRFPTWMDDHPELMTRVLQALSPGQCLTWEKLDEWPSLNNWSFREWNRVLMHVHGRPQWLPSDLPFHTRTPAEQELVLEMLLGTHHPSDLDRVSEILEQSIALPERVLRRLCNWEATQGGISEEQKSHKDYALKDVHLNRLKAALLSHRLPAPNPETTRTRF